MTGHSTRPPLVRQPVTRLSEQTSAKPSDAPRSLIARAASLSATSAEAMAGNAQNRRLIGRLVNTVRVRLLLSRSASQPTDVMTSWLVLALFRRHPRG